MQSQAAKIPDGLEHLLHNPSMFVGVLFPQYLSFLSEPLGNEARITVLAEAEDGLNYLETHGAQVIAKEMRNMLYSTLYNELNHEQPQVRVH